LGSQENKVLVQEYFEKMRAGDPGLPELLHEDIEWWVPQGSRMGGTARGKAAVLELMGSAVGLYDPAIPLQITLEQFVAEGDWVCVQFVIDAKTARGADYHNDYHFAFQIRDGRIVRVKEYVDTAYANAMLMPD
jgi:ketosteroid isomerase-like protein